VNFIGHAGSLPSNRFQVVAGILPILHESLDIDLLRRKTFRQDLEVVASQFTIEQLI
jgi:hypothetical protein